MVGQPIEDQIEETVDNLDAGAALAEKAAECIQEYGDGAVEHHTPTVAAAGAVYYAGRVEDLGHTQAEVADAAGVSRVATGQAYRRLLTEYNRSMLPDHETQT